MPSFSFPIQVKQSKADGLDEMNQVVVDGSVDVGWKLKVGDYSLRLE